MQASPSNVLLAFHLYADDVCLVNEPVYPLMYKSIYFNDVRTKTNDCQPDLLRYAKHILLEWPASDQTNVYRPQAWYDIEWLLNPPPPTKYSFLFLDICCSIFGACFLTILFSTSSPLGLRSVENCLLVEWLSPGHVFFLTLSWWGD